MDEADYRAERPVLVRRGEVGEDLADVVARLAVGRHAAVPVHRVLPGVVAGERKRKIALEMIKQPSQIGHSAV